jgi:hypothetical protein
VSTWETAVLGIAFLWILVVSWLGVRLDARLFFEPYRRRADKASEPFYDETRLDFPFYARRRQVLARPLSDPFLDRRRQIVRWLEPIWMAGALLGGVANVLVGTGLFK